jgi:hypothetical protein
MRLVVVLAGICLLVVAVVPCSVQAGELQTSSGYSLLSPIRSGSLTVFPVVTNKTYDTDGFITLDEGLRSGDVVVTEAGQARGLIRRRPGGHQVPPVIRDAEVNQLVLVNNSKRPLLLLAGEIVTGGKQDRVIGKDRIVPAESDPVDLSVFCVEPGRWTAANGKYEFGAAAGRWYGRRDVCLAGGTKQSDGCQRSATGLERSREVEAGDGGSSGRKRRSDCCAASEFNDLLRPRHGEQRGAEASGCRRRAD